MRISRTSIFSLLILSLLLTVSASVFPTTSLAQGGEGILQTTTGITAPAVGLPQVEAKKADTDTVALSQEETTQLKQWFERVKQLAADSDQAKMLAEKAISDFNAAKGRFDAAHATRTALFFKLCAEKKLDPATVELTADGIVKKPTTKVVEKTSVEKTDGTGAVTKELDQAARQK